MTTVQAAIAANRFGYGAMPGELAQIGRDPRGWLRAQLAQTPAVPQRLAALKPLPDRVAEIRRLVAQNNDLAEQLRILGRETYRADALARTEAAVATDTPFLERLVHFWSNHFTVSATKPLLTIGAIPFENEAIRPHVTGRFRDMLRAVVGHPAMLIYLDNAQSIGPNSRAGSDERGLNENLARELLELHTLGVDGGYTQDDVRELAKILTGWSVGRLRDENAGAFMYRPFIHEPGNKVLLGQTFTENGQDEVEAALTMLARHPSTARFVSTKLARHFIADNPPASAVEHLTKVFTSTDGDLAAMADALIDYIDDEDPLPKIKTPNDLVISALRALGAPEVGDPVIGSLYLMGQMPLMAPSPEGWPDIAEAWAGPEAIVQRIDWAATLGDRVGGLADPVAIGRSTVWPVASTLTQFHVERAPSAAEGLAVLFASPAFQRR